jgi:uncharacterized protein
VVHFDRNIHDDSNDYYEAIKWYTRAAIQGNSEAQSRLGTIYRDGLGVEKNDISSEYWFQKAAKH